MIKMKKRRLKISTYHGCHPKEPAKTVTIIDKETKSSIHFDMLGGHVTVSRKTLLGSIKNTFDFNHLIDVFTT